MSAANKASAPDLPAQFLSLGAPNSGVSSSLMTGSGLGTSNLMSSSSSNLTGPLSNVNKDILHSLPRYGDIFNSNNTLYSGFGSSSTLGTNSLSGGSSVLGKSLDLGGVTGGNSSNSCLLGIGGSSGTGSSLLSGSLARSNIGSSSEGWSKETNSQHSSSNQLTGASSSMSDPFSLNLGVMVGGFAGGGMLTGAAGGASSGTNCADHQPSGAGDEKTYAGVLRLALQQQQQHEHQQRDADKS